MNFKKYIQQDFFMHLLEDVKISDNLRYHLENKINLYENIFRIYSESYFDLINEVRVLYEQNRIAITDEDLELIETDIGENVNYNGNLVQIDAPFLEEKKIGKPFRTPGETKKFAVYVKSPNGNIKKVRFGDPNLKIKNNNPARAKSFRARHKCSEKKDRTKAGYWACRIGRYSKSVGLSSSSPW